MILFNCDYNEGAHPKIMEKLVETNMIQTVGYGEDEICAEARDAIKKACGVEDAYVQFMVGGTQTNYTVIASALRSYQGVFSADTGHINGHETGAVEASGHKVLALPGTLGKITAAQVKEAYELQANNEAFEHMVQPKMVYLSHPTELGTLYTKAELEEMHRVCEECGLYLFLDGARLGYGLAAEDTDVTLQVLAQNCDVFYIGGTKVGALFGEAVVILRDELKTDFRYHIKQRGAMLAKGRLLGIQFRELFRDDLYLEISKHAITLAMKIKNTLLEKGYEFYIDSPTNQQFLIIGDGQLEVLRREFAVSYIQRYNEDSSVVRICTSWATKEEDVDRLLEAL